MGDDELEEIRRRRVAEMRAHQEQAAGDEVRRAQADAQAREEQEAQKEAVLRQVLTPEARERLTRIRMARPEDARALEGQLIGLAQSGRLRAKIDDEQLKQILARLFSGGRDINIRRR